MLNKLAALREKSEDGFTLIELLIVVVIIGILAAIAIPIFLNQQKAAIAGSVKSDVRNTVTSVATELTKDNDMTDVSGVPKTVTNGNTITVFGNWKAYYVLGYNTNALGAAPTVTVAPAGATSATLTGVTDLTSTNGNGYLFNSTNGKYSGSGVVSS